MTNASVPPTEIAALATIRATLARLGMAETALLGARETITRTHSADVDALPLLPFAADPNDAKHDLVDLGLLGSGGMGAVHLARQRSLQRDVAVKTIAEPSAANRRALVREARTTGRLEHPNIVPVHALGANASGDPVLVMKRIEGTSMRTLLDDAQHKSWRPLVGADGDRFRATIEVLVQVARALAFAHAHGVVHRDVKPENVMVGPFGEVYLVDWGIALALNERAAEPAGIVGTPGYMAPEMARGEAHEIEARTDVYLLGGLLYELLTGSMPHATPTALGALVAALRGEIVAPIPDSAPPLLADLARSALAYEPSARPESADAFRAELSRYLVSREADTLVDAGDSALARADELSHRSGPASTEAFRALIEARFALAAALKIRPNDARTIARHDACVKRLVLREVALRSPVAARDALVELHAPDAALEAEIELLAKELSAEKSALVSARRQGEAADISDAWRVIGVIAALGTLVSIPYALLAAPRIQSVDEAFNVGAGIVVALAVLVGLTRKKLLATPGSSRLTFFMCIYAAYVLPLAIAQKAQGQTTFDYATAWATGGVLAVVGSLTVLPRLWPSAFLHVAAAMAWLRWPDRAVPIGSMLLVLNLCVMVLALRQRAHELARARSAVSPGASRA